jgi:hypothetical protein
MESVPNDNSFSFNRSNIETFIQGSSETQSYIWERYIMGKLSSTRYYGKSVYFKYEKLYAVKPVYKGHSREPDNVVFMSICTLYKS